MHVYGELSGSLSGSARITGGLISSVGQLSGELTIPASIGVQPYEGEYTFTPTEDTQTVEIAEKMATQNITINPIPSNYGLITYNGSTITVS